MMERRRREGSSPAARGSAHIPGSSGAAAPDIPPTAAKGDALDRRSGSLAAGRTAASDGATTILADKENSPMRIAIPLADGKLTLHFGHCSAFALIDADPAEKKILRREDVEAPPHQPGLFPPWLAERGVNVILAGGMGPRAQDLFRQHGIQVVAGVPEELPEKLVLDYLQGTLRTGENACDH
jgi:predicted Fe-Mo cluster-binding NifX family protein